MTRPARRLPVQLARHAAFALVAGATGALAAALATLALDAASALSARFPWLLLALPALGAASIGLFRLLGLPLGAQPGSVVEDVRENDRVPPALAPAALAGTLLTVAGGGSAGATATSLAMASSAASGLGRLARVEPLAASGARTPRRGWTAACGMAAAFAALFGAPLAGAAFALELVRFDGAVVRHLPAVLAASLTAWAASLLLPGGYALPAMAPPGPSWKAAALCLLVGLACAAVGTVFGWSLRALRRGFGRARAHPALVAAVGGALVCALVLAFGWQRFEGSGLALLADAFAGGAAPFDFAVKALLTVVTLGFGFKGGEVMPALSVGALLGASCAGLIGGAPLFAAAMGATAFLAAAARCPLAAVLLAAEAFGWAAAPWAALAVLPAYLGSADVGMFGRGITSRRVKDRGSEKER
ncbi:chloride channel protein [Arabiibacter massiliensis]|uniref:chloride channel protein n=1 Tax=Arabiibacter massiliensis TaxID=1870985 RepID=UPI0009BC6BB0|nr:chloride channel protein [Arabiibacter massiliensis]